MSYCRECHREVCRQARLGVAAKKQPAAAAAPAAEGESPAARRRRLDGPGFTALTRGESFAEITGCSERFLLETACELIDDLGVEEFYQEDLVRVFEEKKIQERSLSADDADGRR
jgi:hypothetical protein